MTSAYYFAAHFNSSTQHYFPSTPKPNIKKEEPLHPQPDQNTQHFAGTRYIDPQKTSPFFRLPPELRNKIYAALLCPNTPTPNSLHKFDSHGYKQEPLHPALLQTCKKIYQEAENMLYTTNIFHAHPAILTALPHLLTPAQPVVDPNSIAKISRWQINMRLDTDPRFTAQQATAAFSGAEYLEIKVWQSMFDGCDASVLRLFLGVRGVRVARVNGSVDLELARWLEEKMMGPVEIKVEGECCGCKGERELRCTGCGKVAVENPGSEWFGARDAWTFGNR
ncbi:hypothetical protein T440DRAFT_481213 [Plenodomus tracheiphilus IPT5]|uniref:DUF7730 domain-containing protein n=1 Tax=Plenodomus tracheiphilus IPT5 TaxID=1408161 RepID=A0A6A7B149_9PLEO|nr:hypothetical protein T440DRAFT_481213 [Plenodomus tracheiphilus IPT5]